MNPVTIHPHMSLFLPEPLVPLGFTHYEAWVAVTFLQLQKKYRNNQGRLVTLTLNVLVALAMFRSFVKVDGFAQHLPGWLPDAVVTALCADAFLGGLLGVVTLLLIGCEYGARRQDIDLRKNLEPRKAKATSAVAAGRVLRDVLGGMTMR